MSDAIQVQGACGKHEPSTVRGLNNHQHHVEVPGTILLQGIKKLNIGKYLRSPYYSCHHGYHYYLFCDNTVTSLCTRSALSLFGKLHLLIRYYFAECTKTLKILGSIANVGSCRIYAINRPQTLNSLNPITAYSQWWLEVS